MLFAMLWQSVAMGRMGSTVNALVDLEHASMHWQEEGHHHHGDGSYHLDDSTESVQHVVVDHVGSTVAIVDSFSTCFLPTELVAPIAPAHGPIADPDLEGLLRPPRQHA